MLGVEGQRVARRRAVGRKHALRLERVRVLRHQPRAVLRARRARGRGRRRVRGAAPPLPRAAPPLPRAALASTHSLDAAALSAQPSDHAPSHSTRTSHRALAARQPSANAFTLARTKGSGKPTTKPTVCDAIAAPMCAPASTPAR